MLRIILNNRPLLWAVLALPALMMLVEFANGLAEPVDLVPPSGTVSVRLMILAMIISPLTAALGPRAWLIWLAARRRYFGVAAFGYACLHLLLYVLDMGSLDDMVAELGALGIWTGWLALLLFIPLAATSNNWSMARLRTGWKRLQRLVYPAALLVLIHWVFVHNNLVPALIHFLPLALALIVRGLRQVPFVKQGV